MAELLKGMRAVPSERIPWAHGCGVSGASLMVYRLLAGTVLETFRGHLKIVVSAWKFEVVN